MWGVYDDDIAAIHHSLMKQWSVKCQWLSNFILTVCAEQMEKLLHLNLQIKCKHLSEWVPIMEVVNNGALPYNSNASCTSRLKFKNIYLLARFNELLSSSLKEADSWHRLLNLFFGELIQFPRHSLNFIPAIWVRLVSSFKWSPLCKSLICKLWMKTGWLWCHMSCGLPAF